MKEVRLLKCTRRKGDKRYDNLYLQIENGAPIEIQLAHFNPKLKNFLLANAIDADIRSVVVCVPVDSKKED